uniref:Papilin a, proteoglycan-like sulfated glycoprotein n=1 Tax=Labrus bergylta TaxID=56723 RepID=A0A3Q3GXW9_9LABR
LVLHSVVDILPNVDRWDAWGPYGDCSRSCGSGVTMRTRRCITHRADGGHNCVGPDKSYRSCNIQDCPEGSRDFREEQCSQFDGTDFQGKRYKWLPYYGAENPCELNCMPRGENFFYRHRSAVVDGTTSHRLLTSVFCPPPSGGFPSWRTGEWNTCSVTCGGGSQVRRVECVSQDASGPRVVEDATCAAYAEAPPTLQTCNMHKCAEYRATRWSACSVTCGSGQQTREISCIGSGGMRLEETSCSTLLRPTAVRPCEAAACPRQISWHCSKSCGSGSRDRQVICSDQERNLYAVDQCHASLKPPTVERCNTQSCYSPQVVPSVQDPRGHDNTQTVFRPSAPDHSTGLDHSFRSRYGCCPDGRTTAGGPRGLGCPRAPTPTSIQVLSTLWLFKPLPAGSCSAWTSRYHFDVLTSKCAHFWFGGCHGNSNNFMTRAECQRACPVGRDLSFWP